MKEITKLANFIMNEVASEPSLSESAVDCAIRIIKKQMAEKASSAQIAVYWKKRAETFEKESKEQNEIFLQMSVEMEKIKLIVNQIKQNESIQKKASRSQVNATLSAAKQKEGSSGSEQGTPSSKKAGGQLPNSNESSVDALRELSRVPVTHKLKTSDRVYSDVESGKKNFEIRYDDRGYRVGDLLELQEVNSFKVYTGRKCEATITYMLRGTEWGLQPGYVILGL